MPSKQQASFDAKIFQLILEDIRSELSEDDRADSKIEMGDIIACSKAGSFFPIYDRETDLISLFIELLEPSAEEGSEAWEWVADHVRDDVHSDDPEVPASVAAEITASIGRVLASARLALDQHRSLPRRRPPSSLPTEQLRVLASEALSLVHERYGREGEEGLARTPAGAGPEIDHFRAAVLEDPSLLIELIGGEAALETRLRAFLSTRFMQEFEEAEREFEDGRREARRNTGEVVVLRDRPVPSEDEKA
jgi:hypothetical protein